MLLPDFETERLILRKVKKQDVEAVFNCWMQDPDVSRYMFWEASADINEAKEFIQFELGNINNDRWNRWIIVRKENSEIIGTCLIFWNTDEQHWDISYNLGKKYWGYGYVTEAMKQVMKYGVDVLGIKTCITTCAAANVSSAHVLEKLGFRKVNIWCSLVHRYRRRDFTQHCLGDDVLFCNLINNKG